MGRKAEGSRRKRERRKRNAEAPSPAISEGRQPEDSSRSALARKIVPSARRLRAGASRAARAGLDATGSAAARVASYRARVVEGVGQGVAEAVYAVELGRTERAVAAEQQQQVADHDWRQHQRQVDDGVQQGLAEERAAPEQPGHGEAERQARHHAP